MAIYRNYWLVVGRIIGANEDQGRFYRQCTREEAVELFKADEYESEGYDEDDIALAEANGEGAVVNLIVASDSPIEKM